MTPFFSTYSFDRSISSTFQCTLQYSDGDERLEFYSFSSLSLKRVLFLDIRWILICELIVGLLLQRVDKVARNVAAGNPSFQEHHGGTVNDIGVPHRSVVRPANGDEVGRSKKGAANSSNARALPSTPSSPPLHQQPYNQHVAQEQPPEQRTLPKRGPLPRPPAQAHSPSPPPPVSPRNVPSPGPSAAAGGLFTKALNQQFSRRAMEGSADERVSAREVPPHRSQMPTPPMSDEEDERGAGGTRGSVYFDASTGSRSGLVQAFSSPPGSGTKPAFGVDELGVIPDEGYGYDGHRNASALVSPVSSPESERRKEREGSDSNAQSHRDHHDARRHAEDFISPTSPSPASFSTPNKLKSKGQREHKQSAGAEGPSTTTAETSSKVDEQAQILSAKSSRNKLQKALKTPSSSSPTFSVFSQQSSSATSATSASSIAQLKVAQGRMPVRAPLQHAMDQWVGLEADPFAKDEPQNLTQAVDTKTSSSAVNSSASVPQLAEPSQTTSTGAKERSRKVPSNNAPVSGSNSSPRTRRHGEVRGESLAQGNVRPREVMEALAQVSKSVDEPEAPEIKELVPAPAPDAMEVVEEEEEEKEPTFYPLASHLQHPTLLAALLQFLSFRDWCMLTAVNDAARRSVEHKRELRETVLEYWLGSSVGYERWRWENKEVVQLTFRVRVLLSSAPYPFE